MKTIILAALLALSATAGAQGYGYNNDYVRSMSSDEYMAYDRTQRQIQQSQMQRMHEEQMRQQQLQNESMNRANRYMELDRLQMNSRYEDE